MKKVSIIVPVYKVEKYLRRSMESLVNQTLEDIEIICINDGSPDNSLNILKEYKEKYPDKVVIIDKKNEGVWKGRYDGVKAATGEYIGFTDSDDYIALDYAEKLYNCAKETDADISVCGFYRVDVETEHIYSKEMRKDYKDNTDISKNPEILLAINGALWNKIYKADLLKKMPNLENPPKILDDMMFFLLVSMNANKISFIPDCLYYYMIRGDSIMTNIKKEQIESTQNAMIKIKEIYSKNNKDKELMKVIDSLAFLHFGISLMFRIYYDKSCNFKEELKKNKKFLNEKFPLWRNSKYLSLSYCIKNKGKNVKLAIMKKVYIMNMYRLFLKLYTFMISKFKIDIKW